MYLNLKTEKKITLHQFQQVEIYTAKQKRISPRRIQIDFFLLFLPNP